MSPISSVERTSFGAIGLSYTASIIGRARQSLAPKPAAKPALSQAAKLENSKLPKRGDIGTRFKDDPREFEIRDIPRR